MILKCSSPFLQPVLPPTNIPAGYTGPVHLPTGKEVFWTGRVAIGLRHTPFRSSQQMGSQEEFIQKLMLK